MGELGFCFLGDDDGLFVLRDERILFFKWIVGIWFLGNERFLGVLRYVGVFILRINVGIFVGIVRVFRFIKLVGVILGFFRIFILGWYVRIFWILGIVEFSKRVIFILRVYIILVIENVFVR